MFALSWSVLPCHALPVLLCPAMSACPVLHAPFYHVMHCHGPCTVRTLLCSARFCSSRRYSVWCCRVLRSPVLCCPALLLSCPVLSSCLGLFSPVLPVPSCPVLFSLSCLSSCPALSCPTLSCLSYTVVAIPVLICPHMPCLALFCHVLHCPVVSCTILSCPCPYPCPPSLPCQVLPWFVMSCPLMPSHALSCPMLWL